MKEAPERDRADLFELTHRFLRGAGYEGYEVSNFARSLETRSRHNQKYWRHVPYLGLGPSAHSFDGERRWWNVREHREYRSRIESGRSPMAESEVLTASALALETLMLGLRTVDGVDLVELERLHGLALLERRGSTLDRLVEGGLLELCGQVLRPTLAGLAAVERLAVELAPDL